MGEMRLTAEKETKILRIQVVSRCQVRVEMHDRPGCYYCLPSLERPLIAASVVCDVDSLITMNGMAIRAVKAATPFFFLKYISKYL